MARGDANFIHQHVVDAFAAQDASENDKPIRLTFALVGIFLHLEKGFTGREVQRAHMKLARKKQPWPSFELPGDRGSIRAGDVAALPPEMRESKIENWLESVWAAYSDQKQIIESLLKSNGISDVYSLG